MAHRELTTGLRRCRERRSELCARRRKDTPSLRTVAHRWPLAWEDRGDLVSTAAAGGTGLREPVVQTLCLTGEKISQFHVSHVSLTRYCKLKLCWPKFRL